ncbi:uroporphyrinogen decarboxylase [Celerinatantimonas sp. YJH-8]|uniref:uroporphyrinogen decarboxylase n=1 Tax=Celerinatantimonas sp. YJH-8 TaxID=3228714 RepID=UPI0038C38592
MTELKNDRYLRALLRQKVDRTPVWMMRQAGRYLPEYRALRQQVGDFMSLCRDPDLACEATLQPLRRFELDAAILFSDILTIPDAMGLGLHFVQGEGPRFKTPIQERRQIEQLVIPDPLTDLKYVIDAVTTISHELDGAVPLIGFAGSPWTLATYMVEGGPTKQFAIIKSMMYREPQSLHLLLNKLAVAVTDYLNAQIAAGAQSIMIFDTWGGVLSSDCYRAFSLDYMQQIVEGLTHSARGRRVPVTLFSKNSSQWLEWIAQSGCDAVGIDWTCELGDARARVGHQVALQGNMDPSVLYAPVDVIEQEVARILAQYGSEAGHVFNLGHGIHQDVPPEHVAAFVNAVHRLSQPYHALS